MTKGRKGILGFLLLAAGLVLASRLDNSSSAVIPAFSINDASSQEEELSDGSYYTILDEKGEVLDKTARRVWPGDEFISSNNLRYRVESVTGLTARAKTVGREKIPEQAVPTAAAGQTGSNKVGIYHTHSAESYVPTDGKDSIPGRGGIFKVGDSFSAALKKVGLAPLHDTTTHEPRDSSAYKRSRRTAVRLMKSGLGTLVDVHRDGVPDPAFYSDTIAGQNVTRLRLVVGRQNANMQANLDYAKQVKSAVDQKHPGLVRGIFLGRGNFNQDLTPRAMLIEVGTHTNDRPSAERGVSLFADGVPTALAATGVAPRAAEGATSAGLGGDWKGALWIVVALLIGGGAFLLLSTGSLEGAVSKLRQFTSTEWANFLGPRRGGRSAKKPEGEGSWEKKEKPDQGSDLPKKP